jgi:lysine 2,3-aminomutase
MEKESTISEETIKKAISWISEKTGITEVLISGGDPLSLSDEKIDSILRQLSAISHIERIRIGTRMLVTLPSRITSDLVEIFSKYNIPGKREICWVTHFEHVAEMTDESINAVTRIRKEGMSIYNQQVFTYYNSRRYETSALRRILKLCGIDPYYTFNTKGKKEIVDFRVPIARMQQERKEEARFLPGLVRTDEPVFNIPRFGKSHLRSWQDHEIIMVLADGGRVYRFLPWQSRRVKTEDYLYADVSIYSYLKRLQLDGENVDDYSSIWFYY